MYLSPFRVVVIIIIIYLLSPTAIISHYTNRDCFFIVYPMVIFIVESDFSSMYDKEYVRFTIVKIHRSVYMINILIFRPYDSFIICFTDMILNQN